ncbi:MAG: TldD/PmbA family protein [Vicinamibacteria bacterium]
MTRRDRTGRLPLSVLSDLVARARACGADEADAFLKESESFTAELHLGRIEKLRRSRAHVLGIRIFVGKSCGIASTSDLSRESLDRLVDDACRLARATAADPSSGLPDTGRLGRSPDPAIFDDEGFGRSDGDLIELARMAETAAFDTDSAITNSEGAGYFQTRVRTGLANSSGFGEEYESTTYSLYVAPLAERNGERQRDYWTSTKRRFRELGKPDEVGREAALRAVRRLGAGRVATGRYPVVFDNRVSPTLLEHLATAMTGTSLVRGASFLLGKIGEPVAAAPITLVDDPTLVGGLGSFPFDDEGLPGRRAEPIQSGILKSFFLDTYSGRRLGLEARGGTRRDPGSVPSPGPSNLYLPAGKSDPKEIVSGLKRGLYVTELAGFGFNPVTGDYSRGAVGFLIEDGRLARPVEEITIAGNLLTMLRGIEAIGNDLEFHSEIAAPTLLVNEMTVAGE